MSRIKQTVSCLLGDRYSPSCTLAALIAVIMGCEMLVMLLLSDLKLNEWPAVFLDSALLVILLAPALYWLVVRRMVHHINAITEAEKELLEITSRLREIAITDELTGLYNRRGFFELAGMMSQVALRSKKKMALLFCDMDGLKAINDTWSHAEGDNAIKEAARLLKRTLRVSDIIARMGGDEFAVLLVENDAKGAETAIGRLRQEIARVNAAGVKPYKISLSVGVAEFEPRSGASIDALIAKADTAMYQAKVRKKEAARAAD